MDKCEICDTKVDVGTGVAIRIQRAGDDRIAVNACSSCGTRMITMLSMMRSTATANRNSAHEGSIERFVPVVHPNMQTF